jgi:hypothetical protein
MEVAVLGLWRSNQVVDCKARICCWTNETCCASESGTLEEMDCFTDESMAVVKNSSCKLMGLVLLLLKQENGLGGMRT